jgi:hypothetical protein
LSGGELEFMEKSTDSPNTTIATTTAKEEQPSLIKITHEVGTIIIHKGNLLHRVSPVNRGKRLNLLVRIHEKTKNKKYSQSGTDGIKLNERKAMVLMIERRNLEYHHQ